jgi:IMP dehydrogenase
MRATIGEALAEEMVSLGLIPIFHRFRRPTNAADVDTETPSVQSQDEADAEKFEWLRRFGDRAYFSCGTREGSIAFTKRLIQEGAAGVCVDVAIGNSLATAATVCVLRDFIDQGGYQCQIIAGNVDSAEGYLLLALAGADCIKVGIGPGSACTTRVLTRAGSGQGSALMDVARARFMLGADGPPFIADGGIEGPGDALTALALGAHSVMIGKLAARTKESGGLKRTVNGKEHVWYFGEASWWARKYEQGGVKDGYGVEGKAEWLPVQSSFREVFQEFKGGLTNAFPYYDVRTVDALHDKFCIPQQLCRVILGSTTGIHRAAAGTARESGTRLV